MKVETQLAMPVVRSFKGAALAPSFAALSPKPMTTIKVVKMKKTPTMMQVATIARGTTTWGSLISFASVAALSKPTQEKIAKTIRRSDGAERSAGEMNLRRVDLESGFMPDDEAGDQNRGDRKHFQ